ncbi:MAG TPA: hypothetical protein VGH68_07680, partial [Paraburkholderia sp.]
MFIQAVFHQNNPFRPAWILTARSPRREFCITWTISSGSVYQREPQWPRQAVRETGDHTGLKQPNSDAEALMNASNGENPNSKLTADIACCEMCISLAARAGVQIPEDRLRAVKNARADLDRGEISPETESAFYHAMAYIVAESPYPNAEVADDLKKCSEVVSHAGLNGKKLAGSDVDALAAARQAQRDFSWSPKVEVPFYSAMSRIIQAVAPVVGETVGAEARKGARKAISRYSCSAAILTLLVLALSCLLFAIKQISDDIKLVIQSNDPVALRMHNQLQAYDAA